MNLRRMQLEKRQPSKATVEPATLMLTSFSSNSRRRHIGHILDEVTSPQTTSFRSKLE